MEDAPKSRRRWFRFSLRTMLVLVMLVCMAIFSLKWLRQREQTYLKVQLEHFYLMQAKAWIVQEVPLTQTNVQRLPPDVEKPYFEYAKACGKYYEQLYDKYSHAAKYPWFSVEPDPPLPRQPQEPLPPGFSFTFLNPQYQRPNTADYYGFPADNFRDDECAAYRIW